MAAQQPLQIRSFRVCFKFERRIHKIDRWRIPLPFGVPLAGLGYGACALAVVVVLSGVPVLGALLHVLPAPMRLLVIPALTAYAFTRWRIDGRPAHRSLGSWLRLRLGPSRVAAFRPVAAPGAVRLGSVTLAADDRGARMRPAVIDGPARVTLRYPVRMRERGRAIDVSPAGDVPQWRGTQITLSAGQRVVVR